MGKAFVLRLIAVKVVLCVASLMIVVKAEAKKECFETQYIVDDSFAADFSFANVSDVAVDTTLRQVWILQRSHPPVTVWDSVTGKFLLQWDTQDLGYPHSIELNVFDSTVWITDMAGELAAGEIYGHCVKQFHRNGSYIQSIGQCGQHTGGSSINPPQFDKVTDIAFNSKGYAYITDGDIGGMNNRVLVFNQSLERVAVWNIENTKGSCPLQFNLPHSIRIDKCDRVWVVDTHNHRIQVISDNGVFLGQWNCFGQSLLYGIDLQPEKGSILLTSVTGDGDLEILALSFSSADCSNPQTFGECRIEKRLILSHDQTLKTSVMLHSVAVDDHTGSVYVAALPGNTTPIKYVPVPAPPANNFHVCPEYSNGPPQWNQTWSATALLTPFNESNLITAEIAYSALLDAIYFRLLYREGHVYEYLNIGNETYIPQEETCSGPDDYGWVTPNRQWIANPHNCQCKGTYNASNIETVAWACPTSELIDWYWFHRSDNSLWRMIINNSENPNHFPVFGNYTIVHFTSLGSDISALQKAYDVCTSNVAKHAYNQCDKDEYTDDCKRSHHMHVLAKDQTNGTYVNGFSYSGCHHTLPDWPEQLYMTVTMLPAGGKDLNPLPTSVLYDWRRVSQRTTMCMTTQIYNAYLIANKTYITTQDRMNGEITWESPLPFGPPKPNWMSLDCKCMGTISNNYSLSPWSLTTIVVCPLTAKRVFWAWFTTDFGYRPVFFFETKSPKHEGTDLAVADYHDFYHKDFLIDVHTFEVPEICTPQCRIAE